MFDYVMVLISVVIGLALTHLMQGVAGLIQRPGAPRFWWVHLVWVGYLMFGSVFFWWWEYSLHDLTHWNFQTYLLLLIYAFVIYLSAAVLFPHDLEGYASFEDYFIARRPWFFGLQIVYQILDALDSLAKGTAHALGLGLEYWLIDAAFIAFSVIGIATPRRSVQATIALVFFLYEVTFAFRTFNTLH